MRQRRNLPQWNPVPFTCPDCQRSWGPNGIRTKLIGGRPVCHRCWDEIMSRVSRRGRRRERFTCVTCGETIEHGRLTLNGNEEPVHSGGCPRKT